MTQYDQFSKVKVFSKDGLIEAIEVYDLNNELSRVYHNVNAYRDVLPIFWGWMISLIKFEPSLYHITTTDYGYCITSNNSQVSIDTLEQLRL